MDLSSSNFHFIGVGGIGMCGLAELLRRQGATVSGSDQQEGANTRRLRELGVRIEIGHAEANLKHPDVVVFSSAIPQSNVELCLARQRGIPVIPRAEALAEIMRLKRGIAIAGTHGKTTTASLVASVFIHGELDPTVVVGGRLQLIESTARLGASDWFIAEADESDGSFSKLSPEIAIVTNIDADHLDHFKNMEAIREAFLQFAEKVPFYGQVIACGDCAEVRRAFQGYQKKVAYYGFDEDNDYVIRADGDRWSVFMGDVALGTFGLSLPGRHNVLNACAAFLCGLRAGLGPEQGAAGLQKFNGVDRRFQKVGVVRGADIIDDYGHHPTEISAVLQAASERYPEKEKYVVFQPHRFSRTADCWGQFKKCFELADKVYLLDIYPAGEAPRPGIDAQSLVEEINLSKVSYRPWGDELYRELSEQLSENAALIVMGAGSISRFSREFVERHGLS